MGNLTDKLMKIASESNSSADTIVQDALDELLTGDSKEAGIKMANLSEEQMDELRAELSKHGQSPEMETHGTVENPKAEVRKTVPEEKSRTEARPAKEDEDIRLGKGLGAGDGSGSHPTGTSPTISELLSPPIKETERTPEGGGDTDSDLKTAAFEAGWVDGIKQTMTELIPLISKHGSLNISERFGDVFDKIASVVGEEEAATVLQEGFAEGQKMAMMELESKEEVKMGSLKKLAEDQEKIASVEDLREYGRVLGREALLTKIAEDQKKATEDQKKTAQGLVEEPVVEEPVVEEPVVEEGGVDEAEVAAAAEASQIIDAIAEKALTDPASLEPEEAEILLEVADAIEDAEGEAGVEKVTTVLDVAAALRQNGYGE